MDLYDHGRDKYGAGDVLGTAVGCDWSGVAAELRYHPPGALPPVDLVRARWSTDAATASGNAPRHSPARSGPVRRACEIAMNEWHECLHIYLPHARFAQLSDIRGGAIVTAGDISYLADIDDALIRQIGWTFLAELKSPTSAGRVLVETLDLALTARLVHAHAAGVPDRADRVRTHQALDDVRVRRVIEYMAAHIGEEIGIDAMAAIACLSPSIFIRMFRRRIGMPPSRYLGKMRLDRAKKMLADGDRSLVDIAAACQFSSQANFTRAFHRATGSTPGVYRKNFLVGPKND